MDLAPLPTGYNRLAVSTQDDLKAKINLILSQVDSSAPIYTLSNPKPFFFAALADVAESKRGSHHSDLVIASPGDAEVVNEQIPLLKILYAQCSPEQQPAFIPLLLAQLNESNAAVVVHSALELGGLIQLKKVLDDPDKLSLAVRLNVWKALREKVAKESHTFTDADLDLLEKVRSTEIKRQQKSLDVWRKISREG